MTVRMPVLVIGAGGHAKVCVDVLRARFEPVGCIDLAAGGGDEWASR
jgi:hypothetical protein